MTAQHAGVGEVFSTGAEEFHRWSPRLWDPVGEATAAVAAPAPGECVLDACCGAGASALPAARAVGPGGHVDAVDLSGPLLDVGEQRARQQALANVHFRQGDVTDWNAPGDGYDLVQCALGVFFFPDMDRGTAVLVRLLRPGGRLAVTVWERGALGGWRSALKKAVEAEREWPDPPHMARRARIDTPGTLTDWLEGLGLTEVAVERSQLDVLLTAATAWELVVGSGTRALLEGLAPAAVDRVRARFAAHLHEESVTDLDVRILTATGRV